MRIRATGLAIALLSTTAAYAVDEAAFARCRGIPDAATRLRCYDGLPLGSPPPAPPAPPVGRSPPPAPAPAPVAPPGAPKAAPPPQSFGMESRAPAEPLPATMESFIPGRFGGWGPGSRIKLGNGQVWQVVDGTSAIFDVENPKVVIRRGMMGGFFLEVENSNRSPRVRRLQ